MSRLHDEIEACIPALRRYACALTRDRDAADDLVHDCIERALRKHRLWGRRGPLRSWLFTIMLNIYRNDRRRSRAPGQFVAIDDLSDSPSIRPEQPGRIALAETLDALDRLPAEQREALLLVALEGFSYAEAAGILGIPPGTLMSRLGRARTALRRMTEAPAAVALRSTK